MTDRRCLAAVLALATLLAAGAARAEDLRATALNVHNREREALGLPPLTWSPRLAQAAAQWAEGLADRGEMEHSPWNARRGQGENLAMGTRGAFSSAALMRGWVREKRYFRYAAFPEFSSTGRWQDVAHYTQMIWKGTTQVGCARARGRRFDFLVCRYAPPGNYVGRKPY
ncbi:MAG: CAP domain-containing protein [Caulobacter sp.]|nr:CAP domain-containing protein [Caulobacter sp.]